MPAQHFVRILLVVICLGSLLAMTPGLRAQPNPPSWFDDSPVLVGGAPVTLLAKQTPSTARFLPSVEPGARIQAATFTVNYTGFPPQAQAAFQRAVDIWSSEISSPVPIVIHATWKPLGVGVLGAAGPVNFALTSPSAPQPNTLYPIALGNKLAGTDLDPTSADIIAEFNSSLSNWYFGTDGNAPANTYDLVTVVMHEIGHGLGFLGTMEVSNGTGRWGLEGFPLIYDRLTVNGSNQQLINTSVFANPSPALGTQLTGNNLFFNGPNAIAAAGGTRPRLFAPATWLVGSSYSHLDETAYPTGNANALMTPALDDGEVLHDVGAIARGVFLDLGWTIGDTTPTNTPSATSGTRTATGTATRTVTVGTVGPSLTATRTATIGPDGVRRFLPIVGQGSTGSSPTARTATSSRTSTATVSATRSPTRSATASATGTATQTATATEGGTATQTSTASMTSTATTTSSPTASATNTPTATATNTPSRTPSSSATRTPSRTPSITLTSEGT